MGPFFSAIVAALMASLAASDAATSDRLAPMIAQASGEAPTLDRAPALLGALLLVAFAWMTSRFHVTRRRPEGSAIRRQPVWAAPADLAIFGMVLFTTDWPGIARETVHGLPFLTLLFTLVPWILASVARVDAVWPFEHRPVSNGWTRARTLSFHGRLILIPIIPVILIQGLRDALARIAGFERLLAAYSAAEFGVTCLLFAVIVAAMPFLLSALLGTRRIGDAALDKILTEDLARSGLPLRRVDEVDTGGLIANAAFVGLLPRLSRIFVTDALLGLLPLEGIRAVFAHEMGHGVRRHLRYFLFFFLAVILSFYALEDVFQPSAARGLAPAADTQAVMMLSRVLQAICAVVLLIGGLLLFVVVSRRFEIEADLFAAEFLGDAELFNRSLEMVGGTTGRSAARGGLRHWSVRRRIDIVRACAADPAVRESWRRKLRIIKGGIVLFFCIVTGLSIWKAPGDIVLARARLALMNGESQGGEDLFKRALAGARDALEKPLVRRQAATVGVAAAMALADEALKRGDYGEARKLALEVEANWPPGDPIGDFNRKMLAAELAAVDPAAKITDARDEIAAAIAGIEDLKAAIPWGSSGRLVEQELRFLAAASGVAGAELAYDPEAFESSRILALARGASTNGSEKSEGARALSDLPKDSAWRRRVLERALGDITPEQALSARFGPLNVQASP